MFAMHCRTFCANDTTGVSFEIGKRFTTDSANENSRASLKLERNVITSMLYFSMRHTFRVPSYMHVQETGNIASSFVPSRMKRVEQHVRKGLHNILGLQRGNYVQKFSGKGDQQLELHMTISLLSNTQQCSRRFKFSSPFLTNRNR